MIAKKLKSIILTFQVCCPDITDLKASVMAIYRKIFSRPRARVLSILKYLDVSCKRPVLDIGGATGQSAAAMQFFIKNISVISFEPNPFFVSKMRNRFRKNENIRIEPVAIADKPGQLSLFFPIYRYATFPELGTLNRVDAQNWLKKYIFGYNEDNLSIAELSCKIVSLDSLNIEPEVIFIDTRCNASNVILGATNTISSNTPAILLESEILTDAAYTFLNDIKYYSFQYDGNQILYVNKKEPCDLLLTENHIKSDKIKHLIKV